MNMKWWWLIKSRELKKDKKMIPEEVRLPLSQQQAQVITPPNEASPPQTEPSSDSDCHL